VHAVSVSYIWCVAIGNRLTVKYWLCLANSNLHVNKLAHIKSNGNGDCHTIINSNDDALIDEYADRYSFTKS